MDSSAAWIWEGMQPAATEVTRLGLNRVGYRQEWKKVVLKALLTGDETILPLNGTCRKFCQTNGSG